MATEEDKLTDEARIRQLIDGFVEGIRTRDLHGVMSVYSPDIVWFDFMAPLRHAGKGAYSKLWEKCLASYEGPIEIEIRDLNITVGNDVGFSHSLNRFTGAMKNGQKYNFWFRWTACFRRIDGRWMVAHEHISMPFDMETNKALWDLEP